MYDLIVKNAEVLDGLGNDARICDVAVKDGKIARIGTDLCGAEKIIDATGLTLSPGWIDSHSHSDRSYLTYPDMKEKVEQGITFSIAGQCGGSAAPSKVDGRVETVGEFFEKTCAVMQGSGSAMLIGFNSIRKAVMNRENREPTSEELSRMCELLREGMRAGALGMSYGVYYVPGCYAKTEELITLARVVKEEGGILAAHLRNEADGFIEAVEEYIEIIKASGCRAVFSHHKCAEPQNWGKVKRSIELIEKANAEGADIYMDAYPYIASGTTMMARFCPVQFHPPGTTNALDLLYDPEVCAKIKAWALKKWNNDLSFTLVSACPGYEEYQGKTVSEIAKMRGQENDECEAALDIIRLTKGAARGSFFSMNEEDVKYVLSHPRVMICTDSDVAAAAKIYHPRLRASFPRALGRYARDLGIVSVPEMIRKMTSLPAHVYDLKTKGVIAEGMDADLCIFDAERIIDRADFINFSENNEGLAYVIIDGKIVLENGMYNGTRAAKIHLRREKI